MNFSDMINLMIAVAGSLIGVIVGAYVSLKRERQKESEEIRTVRTLLNEDFNQIDQLLIQNIISLQEIREDIQKKDDIINKMLNKNSWHTFPDELSAVAFDVVISSWNAIEKSGILFKLKPKEIRLLQSLQNSTERANTEMFASYKKITGVLRNLINDQSIPKQKKKKEVKEVVDSYLEQLLRHRQHTWEIIQNISNQISWITLKEMSSSSPTEIEIDYKGSWSYKKTDLRKYVKQPID